MVDYPVKSLCFSWLVCYGSTLGDDNANVRGVYTAPEIDLTNTNAYLAMVMGSVTAAADQPTPRPPGPHVRTWIPGECTAHLTGANRALFLATARYSQVVGSEFSPNFSKRLQKRTSIISVPKKTVGELGSPLDCVP